MKFKYQLALVVFSVFFWGNTLAQKNGANLVSSATPEATEAGALILEKGGNAIDAAVAIAFALGVTEPAMSGLGARMMLIVSIPDAPPIAIGGHSISPSILQTDISKENLTYYKQASIPSQVKILQYIWKKYGSGNLAWEELLAPAIGYAEKGFVLGVHRHQVFKKLENKLTTSPFHNRELLIEEGIPFIGDTIKQATLAKTLQRLAIHGADDFYKGAIAREIAEDFKNNNGWITYEDLANFPDPEELEPLHTNYRAYDVYSFVPPGGGWQVLQILNLLEQFIANKLNKYNQERVDMLIKAINLSHNDRLENPIVDYKNYLSEIKKKISKEYAAELLDSTTIPNNNNFPKEHSNKRGQGETTHFSVVDNQGIAVSATASIGAYFGSLTSTKSLGFFYNSYLKSLMGFGLGKSLESNIPIPSSMSPSLVRKNGKNVLVIGTPGSKRIVSTIAQLIQLWIDGEESIDKIIKYPRVHAIQNKVYLEEEKMDSKKLQEIRVNGYKIISPAYDLTKGGLNAYFGGVHAIAFKNGVWKAAADPRRDGTVSNNQN